MKLLQARVNHKSFQRTEEYINASDANKAYLLPMTLRDKMKYDLAEFIEQNMVTLTHTGSVYIGNPFISDGAWNEQEITSTSIKLYVLTEEEFNNLKIIKDSHEHNSPISTNV